MGIIKDAKERLATNVVEEWISIQGHWETAKKLPHYVAKYPDEATRLLGKDVVSILKRGSIPGGMITLSNKYVKNTKLKKLIRTSSLSVALLLLRKDFWKNAEDFIKKCEELDELYPDNEEDVDVDDDDEEEDEPEPENKKKDNKKSGKKNDKDFEDVK